MCAGVKESSSFTAAQPPIVDQSLPEMCNLPFSEISSRHEEVALLKWALRSSEPQVVNLKEAKVVMVKVDLSQTSQTWRGAFHVELRAEATSLASRGWPVLPGTHPESVLWGSSENETPWQEPMPVQDNWRELLDRNSLQAVEQWQQPYSLLVATGLVLDAV